MKKLFILVFTLFLCTASIISVSAQCAMCRATVESNSKSKDNAIGKGLNKGILYLMTIPYIMVAVVGGLWYYNSKKNARRIVLSKKAGRLSASGSGSADTAL